MRTTFSTKLWKYLLLDSLVMCFVWFSNEILIISLCLIQCSLPWRWNELYVRSKLCVCVCVCVCVCNVDSRKSLNVLSTRKIYLSFLPF